jgi:hypothetical protein
MYLEFTDATDLLHANQSLCDTYIGPDNYDLGYLFDCVPAGELEGIATAASVCSEYKAEAMTQAYPPQSAYTVLVMAHEVGHQFGAQHTFNSNCSPERYHGYEPGIGSTLMSYASPRSCDSYQMLPDPYFHTRTLDEIETYLLGNYCATEISTGNHRPQNVIAQGNGLTIPKETPFQLSATASDPDRDPFDLLLGADVRRARGRSSRT